MSSEAGYHFTIYLLYKHPPGTDVFLWWTASRSPYYKSIWTSHPPPRRPLIPSPLAAAAATAASVFLHFAGLAPWIMNESPVVCICTTGLLSRIFIATSYNCCTAPAVAATGFIVEKILTLCCSSSGKIYRKICDCCFIHRFTTLFCVGLLGSLKLRNTGENRRSLRSMEGLSAFMFLLTRWNVVALEIKRDYYNITILEDW